MQPILFFLIGVLEQRLFSFALSKPAPALIKLGGSNALLPF
jgi:hypothetical protein